MIITPPLRIGIIGGTGRTGTQFANLFSAQGFSVEVTRSKTCKRNKAYELELNVIGRFLDDNPDLYGSIILDNPDTLKILHAFSAAVDDCIKMVEKKRHEIFF